MPRVRKVLLGALLVAVSFLVAQASGLISGDAAYSVALWLFLLVLLGVPVWLLIASYRKRHMLEAILGGLLIAFAVATLVAASLGPPEGADAAIAVPFLLVVAVPFLLVGAIRKAKPGSPWERRISRESNPSPDELRPSR